MKIFVLLSRFPYPLEKGDKLRAYYQLKELSKRHEIHLHTLTDQEIKSEWKKELEAFCTSVTIYKLSKPLLYWNTLKQTFSDKPFQIGYFYQLGIQRKIKARLAELNVDHIYCQLIRTAEYVKNVHDTPKTIDYMDALSKGMFRRAEINVGLKKRLFRNEGKRLSEYENRIFDYFNHHSIISEQDRELINHPNKAEIRIIENGISEDFSDYKSTPENNYDLLFTGNMNYPPNIECSEFIAEQILPILEEKNTVLLSGASPNQRILNLKSDQVTVSGWVDDIRDSYAAAKIFVAPLFIGTGLQNKLLEAMAMGIPCITTSLANNALKAKHGESILVANTAKEFKQQIEALQNDTALYQKIADNGKNYVRNSYSWEQSVQKLDSLFSVRE